MTPDLMRSVLNTPLIARVVIWAPHITRAMVEFDINTPQRQAAWFAQIGHESGGLRYVQEIWGPTEAQVRYEPPSSLAERLGNTMQGDGYKFRGRGPIQITGRYNYRTYGEVLGLNLEAYPELLEQPEHASRAAAAFWRENGCNELADIDYFTKLTKRINGGTNGLADRKRRWEIAKNVLGI